MILFSLIIFHNIYDQIYFFFTAFSDRPPPTPTRTSNTCPRQRTELCAADKIKPRHRKAYAKAYRLTLTNTSDQVAGASTIKLQTCRLDRLSRRCSSVVLRSDDVNPQTSEDWILKNQQQWRLLQSTAMRWITSVLSHSRRRRRRNFGMNNQAFPLRLFR